jgi:hydrogenase maturation protease
MLHRVTVSGVATQPIRQAVLTRLRHDAYPSTMIAVVACFGNVLRADDGVGAAVAQALADQGLPDGVRVLEVGIGGIHLVQELLSGVDLLLIVDAVDLGRPPGSVVVQRPQVLDVRTLSVERRRDELADMHLATPARALMMALGLGVLPAATWLVGIQTTDTVEPRQGLSEQTARAVPVAVQEVRRLLSAHPQAAS